MSGPLDFVVRYSDEERHPIISDCDDWDDVASSLVWLEETMRLWCVVVDEDAMRDWMNVMRVFFESLYVSGYYRGRDEQDTNIDNLFNDDVGGDLTP